MKLCDYLYKMIQHHYYSIYSYKVTYDLLNNKTIVAFSIHPRDYHPYEYRFPLDTDNCEGLDLCIDTLELAVEQYHERKHNAEDKA